MSGALPEQMRKEVFRTLVNVQDEGSTVEDSRDQVAAQFQIDADMLRGIEREGIDKQWAPL